ncbi:MAG TPA: porin [Herbaspirillum sp.]|jgi:predicted porin
MQFKSFGIAIGAAATSLLLAGNAAAQTTNVTVYGIIDAGPEIINNAGPNGNSLQRISSGNLTGSRIGFRGVEDLGGGLSAIFTLENGLDVSTGMALQGGRMFGRQAFVGLQGNWGSLLVGRQNSLQLDWMSKYNTMDNATWSSKVHDASFSDRLDNAVKYTVKVADPVEISTYYSTGYDSTKGGEVAGSSKAGRQYGLGSQYNNGMLRLAAVYDSKNGLTAAKSNDTDRHLTLAARYRITPSVEAMGGYLFRKQDTANVVTRTDMYWVGAAWQITGPFQFSASYYHTNLKHSDQDPSSIITLLKYTLSKRTDLYLINSYVMNRGGSTLGVNGFDSDITDGHNQFGTMFGIRHTF